MQTAPPDLPQTAQSMREGGVKCKLHKGLKKVKRRLRIFLFCKNDRKYQTVIITKEFREYSSHVHFLKNVLEDKIQKTKMT